MKIAIKMVNKPLEIVDIDCQEGARCEWEDFKKIAQIDDALDTVQLSPLPYSLMMYVDDNGLLKDLPVNFMLLTPYGVQAIVGNVFFARSQLVIDELEYYSLTDSDIAFIQKLIAFGSIK